MKLKQAIKIVRKYKFYITVKEFADALCLTSGAVNKRIQREGDLKYDEAFMLAKAFALPIKLFFQAEALPETIVVDYLELPKMHLYKDPNFQKYFLDFQIIYKYKRAYNKNDFKLVAMPNDKLSNPYGRLWIKYHDILLVDTSETDINNSGYYIYTCGSDYISCAYIEKNFDGTVSFEFTNPETVETRTEEFLQEAKFKVIARVIKNLYFFA